MPEYRNLQGELRVLEQTSDFLFPIEIWAYNDKLTRNGWRFENLEEHREKWAGIPVLCAYVNGGKTVGDGHNQSTKRDRDGNAYQSFTAADAERIVGATSDDAEDIRIEAEDDNKWLVAKATLYRWYAKELTDKIITDAVQGGVMSVSIEALVTESHMDGDVEVETSYTPLGITILGDGVAPAVPGAHVAMLTEMESEFKELKLRAASYVEAEKPQNNHPTQKGMKHRMRFSKQQVRELQAKFGDYTVLAAEQNENGVIVCLMSKAGKTAIYKMENAEEAVVLDRVEAINAQTHFCAEGCDDVLVDACDMVELMGNENAALEASLNSANTALEQANATIEHMVASENARRLSAAKEKATSVLSAFNANRETKIDVKVLENLNKDIDAGKFTALADESGNWIGESAVEEKVLSLCAAAVMEQDKANAQKATEPMTWGSVRKAAAKPGTVGELFANQN